MIELDESFRVVRVISAPITSDADWIALQELPAEIETVSSASFAAVHLKVLARSDGGGGGINGSCTVQVVAVGETLTEVLAPKACSYGTGMVATGGPALAVRITAASGSPSKLQVMMKGVAS